MLSVGGVVVGAMAPAWHPGRANPAAGTVPRVLVAVTAVAVCVHRFTLLSSSSSPLSQAADDSEDDDQDEQDNAKHRAQDDSEQRERLWGRQD